MQSANRIHIAVGALTSAIGTFPLLGWLGVLPSRSPQPGDAPAWIGAAIGLAFFLAGVAVIVRCFAGADDSSGELPASAPRALRHFYAVLVMPVPVLLAALLSWVAFGPGERHFSMSIGDGAVASAVPGAHDIVGRVMFGVCAVLAWCVVGYMFWLMLRRSLFRR